MATKKGIKVSKLAEDLKLDPKDLLKTLKDLGVAAKTSASVITEEEAKTVEDLLSKDKKEAPEVPEKIEPVNAEPAPAEIKVPPKNTLTISGDINVKDLSEKLNTKPSNVIKELMRLGILATINQRIDLNIVREVAKVFDYEVVSKVAEEASDSRGAKGRIRAYHSQASYRRCNGAC